VTRGRTILPRATTAVATAAIMLGLAGCGAGGAGPAATTASVTTAAAPLTMTTSSAASSAPTTAAIDRADRSTHELPTSHRRPTVDGGWRTPARAVEVFASAYINWTAASVVSRLHALGRASVGQARSAVTLQASEVARDGELRRGGLANAGAVEAIGPVAGRPREYAVVTREHTTAARSDAYQGLRPAWHVAIATVTRLPGGLWVLSGWQPEN
jgi:hypothetical protein